MQLGTEEIFTVGQDTYCSGISFASSHGVIFEDDLATGYFYAVDTKASLLILDAFHIYDVDNVIDKDKPCKIQIIWSDDGLIAALLINNYCHAIFDFKSKAGYCRNGFPDAQTDWIKTNNRILTNKLIGDIFSD